MKENCRWGILGAGRIAEKFCAAVCFVEGSEVYAVASRDREKAKAYAGKYNASRFYDNYEDLVLDDKVDVVYIATPHPFHFAQTMLCIQHKKAVLCEKPLSLSYRHTAEMINAARKHQVFLMEGMWTACMPFMEKIKELIAADIIGKPQNVEADFGFDAIKDLQSRLYSKALGGGAALDIGIYPVSLATIILGEPSLIKSISKQAETGVDEYSNVVLQYPGGETAHVLSTITLTTPVEASIIGTKGRIKIDSPWFKATDLSVEMSDGTRQSFSMPHPFNGFEHEIREVMYCLETGLHESSKVPHELTLTVSKITDEVLRQAGVSYD